MTPGAWAAIVAAIGLLLTVLNIIDKVITLSKQAQAPDKLRDERISKLETDLTEFRREVNDKIKEYDENITDNLDNINEVRDTMLTSTAVIMRSLQALTTHALDGNNNEELKLAKKELNDYLYTGQLRGRTHES